MCTACQNVSRETVDEKVIILPSCIAHQTKYIVSNGVKKGYKRLWKYRFPHNLFVEVL